MKEMFNRMTEDASKNYSGYRVSTELVEPEGWGEEVTFRFHWIGRNATHGFGIALLDDGRIAKLGRDLDDFSLLPDDYERDWCKVFDHGDPPGYLGHY